MIKLYSDPRSPDSHRTRLVLEEKELPVTLVEVEADEIPDELLEINPYGQLPTVVDRDIVFFDATIVNEYLDERYPHPPLKPGSPADRAQMRLAVKRIEQELYPIHADLYESRRKRNAMAKMKEYLSALDAYMARQEWFVGEQYTLADITIAPILYRLDPLGVDTSKMPNLEAYMDRLFERPAFERSLSEYEQMLRH
ncbi:MAG: glutathione binding-like protein [Mariprofundaceae bacterium]